MSMLSDLLAMPKAILKSKLQSIDASAVKGRGLRRKFEKIRSKKEGGFTLLELLVVVAILAAIGSTATIVLHDTDRKAAAGAHVQMMDQLAKGIMYYAVLNEGNYPDEWDSLFASATGAPLSILSGDLITIPTAAATDNIKESTLSSTEVGILAKKGIKNVRILDSTETTCANTALKTTILDKTNDVTPQNVYRSVDSNGCGVSVAIAANNKVMEWNGGEERVNAATGDRLVVFGVGPNTTLFETDTLGSLTGAPVYRHVEKHEYNRFLAVFNIKNGEVTFQAIVDGAGDTKDEELGELDNVRAT